MNTLKVRQILLLLLFTYCFYIFTNYWNRTPRPAVLGSACHIWGFMLYLAEVVRFHHRRASWERILAPSDSHEDGSPITNILGTGRILYNTMWHMFCVVLGIQHYNNDRLEHFDIQAQIGSIRGHILKFEFWANSLITGPGYLKIWEIGAGTGIFCPEQESEPE